MKTAVSRKRIIRFLENNQEKLYRIAFSYTKRREDALDLVHDTIIKALQKKHTVRSPEYFETWFYRILINECLCFLRKSQKTIYLDDLEDYPEISVEYKGKIDYEDLYNAIDHLSPQLRTVIIFRFFEDMKLDQIAKITNTNLSTTKSRLYRALKILKIDIEGNENDL